MGRGIYFSQRSQRRRELRVTLFSSVLLFLMLPPAYSREGDLERANKLNQEVLVLYKQGNYAGAVSIAIEVLSVREKGLGKEHPLVAESLNNLAALYYSLGDFRTAEPLYERALAIREKTMGPEHPLVIQSLNNLAMLYRDQGDLEKAEQLFLKALERGEKVLGPEHPRVDISRQNLASIYEARGDGERARKIRGAMVVEKQVAKEMPIKEKPKEAPHGLIPEKEMSGGGESEAEKLERQSTVSEREPVEKEAIRIRPFEDNKHTSSYPYTLRLGSFRTLNGARNAVAVYTKKGISPYWIKVDLKEKGIWYRIFAGYFKEFREAEEYRRDHGLVQESSIMKADYAILIGTYGSEKDLEAQARSLEELDYLPYVIKDQGGESRLYVGAFSNRASANVESQELKSRGIEGEVVKR